jgi:hypothetical protein
VGRVAARLVFRSRYLGRPSVPERSVSRAARRLVLRSADCGESGEVASVVNGPWVGSPPD